MTRYDGAQKEQTRTRIIDSAGRRLKSSGIDGSGVSTLMKDAGLTNGAFYAHFASKDDLVATTIADQLRLQHDTIEALPDDRASLDAFIADYLSPRHRDHPEAGCPSSALLTEIARSKPVVRESYTTGVEEIIDLLASRIHAPDAYTRAIGLITTLIATVQLSRAIADPAASDAVLAAGLVNARNFLD
ncbi:TetR/AcrR family transcriptional regulator [Rhodococcus sp. 06-156-3C]|uniref:TetR/AcrR family transcriptional regulator n=1 Tax=Nocardiaceae TaxID=85025 RepID=UPI000522F16A|nr:MULTISPECIES: TetR/AcrR family transcriptional regulator [Rhodococcus]OZC58628.1 TetR/AcrR family transcriptional regulator [Rhodococcus sp. 06-621-2]OZD11357.1 TetR/AcrR family transcriptional regulator [Rhodococcus sp. 06-156-3C]OZD13592.1 TetR/AcrR family transcriptional regulator [Rhodococcus sp. 06-156-4a]OZD22069.1 TetR/AcrR family transcriptional regulator [Rhodococcus sp. 06-156-4C]OZD30215.1 TetR/AcrR family transcriptional regulator [Rhodococcus sp. 06-156-3]